MSDFLLMRICSSGDRAMVSGTMLSGVQIPPDAFDTNEHMEIDLKIDLKIDLRIE